MTETDGVLAANLEFYRAFTTCDYPAMNALWARSAPVLCIHPGWPPLAGREAVMRSWRNLLASPEPTRVACHDDQAFLYGDFALVICEEELSGGPPRRHQHVRQGSRALAHGAPPGEPAGRARASRPGRSGGATSGADRCAHYRIAAIPGDGIGQEVIPAGLAVLDGSPSEGGFRARGRIAAMGLRPSTARTVA